MWACVRMKPTTEMRYWVERNELFIYLLSLYQCELVALSELESSFHLICGHLLMFSCLFIPLCASIHRTTRTTIGFSSLCAHVELAVTSHTEPTKYLNCWKMRWVDISQCDACHVRWQFCWRRHTHDKIISHLRIMDVRLGHAAISIREHVNFGRRPRRNTNQHPPPQQQQHKNLVNKLQTQLFLSCRMIEKSVDWCCRLRWVVLVFGFVIFLCAVSFIVIGTQSECHHSFIRSECFSIIISVFFFAVVEKRRNRHMWRGFHIILNERCAVTAHLSSIGTQWAANANAFVQRVRRLFNLVFHVIR